MSGEPIIAVVGSLNMDLVVPVERHPSPGETVLGGDYANYPGGKGANQAVAAARSAGSTGAVRMFGRVGDDAFGRSLRAAMERDGVLVDTVLATDAPTGVAFIQVDEAGENVIVVSPGANARLSPRDLEGAWERPPKALLMQLETPLETVLEAAKGARRAGALVILSVAPARALSAEELRDVSLVIVNQHEAAMLLHTPEAAVRQDPEAAARALLGLVPRAVITLAADGAVWAHSEGSGRQPAFPATPVDTTAAGDAFSGALAVRLAEGGTLDEAVGFACAAGALAVETRGAQPSLPHREEIEELLANARAAS